MVKIIIIEKDSIVIKQLEKIILDNSIGIILDCIKEDREVLDKIKNLQPDLVIVDYNVCMKNILFYIKEIKRLNEKIKIIMISNKKISFIVEKAYASGIECYLQKPINGVELKSIIEKISNMGELTYTIKKIKELASIGEKQISQINNIKDKNCEETLKCIMQEIGIYSETGSNEVIEVVKYLVENNKDVTKYTLKQLFSFFTNNTSRMEQRFRRIVTNGMINLANIGIEDYLNETFTRYSNSIYNFDQVKKEMDYIRGKSKERGTVNLKKFIGGLVYYCE